MWRTSAIRSMLLQDLCSLGSEPDSDSSRSQEAGLDNALRKARRRAAVVVALDWSALAILFLMRGDGGPWLTLGPAEESIFTIGILIVAVHSGFRLGQLEKLRAVSRLLEELDSRSPDS